MIKRKILLIPVLLFVVSLTAIKFTRSYFTDTEKILGNSIQVGTWGITPVATPETTITPTPTETPSPEAPTPTSTETPMQTPTPTNTPTPTPTNTPTPITARLVINEVYYRGDSSKEWVELYNAGTANADLSGWTITDNTYSDTLTVSSLILPPNSFAVVVGIGNSGQVIAGGAIKIILDTAIGSGLADDGDRLILKDNFGNIVDQMNYGNDTAVWNPARAGVPVGHSLERSPVGKDTDTAADFIDQSIPSPGS